MQRFRRASSFSANGAVLLCAAGLLSTSRAFAHIDLLEPEARAHGTAARGDTDIDVNSNLKSGPCGQVTSGRTERVTTYAPGQAVTVRVREENAHVSYLRVSIDLDGEDFPLRSQAPAGPETQEVAAAAEDALGGDGLLAVYREDNDTPGFVHEIGVTLPDVTCTNCTLQVIQFMYDDPAAPYYFQCADLVIAEVGAPRDAGQPGETTGATGTNPGPNGASKDGGATSAEAANAASPEGSLQGAPGATASGGASAPADTTPSAADSVAAAANSVAVADDGGGCSLSRSAQRPGSRAWLALVGLGLACMRRRR